MLCCSTPRADASSAPDAVGHTGRPPKAAAKGSKTNKPPPLGTFLIKCSGRNRNNSAGINKVVTECNVIFKPKWCVIRKDKVRTFWALDIEPNGSKTINEKIPS